MMGLEHQNIVKAYQCSVWSKKQQEEMLKVGSSVPAACACDVCAFWCLAQQVNTHGIKHVRAALSSCSRKCTAHAQVTVVLCASTACVPVDCQRLRHALYNCLIAHCCRRQHSAGR